LLPFEREDVVGPLIGDGRGDFFLASHPGIDSHETPGHLQRREQFGDGGDLVGFVVGADLAERQVLLRSPSLHHMQRRLVGGGALVAAPELLSVDGSDLSLGRFASRTHPPEEAPLELLRIDAGEDVSDPNVS
jgi:hypothetical protein